MSLNFRKGRPEDPEINLIPFIDILLVILIFLMLSTTYSKFTELQITLPTADAEKMRLEAGVLKENPMLIQKIIAERLSDKVQIMMVPNDGKYFFANDVLRSAMTLGATPNPQ